VLSSRSLPFIAAILAVLLASPSLHLGFVADDHFHHLKIVGSPEFPQIEARPLDMFSFVESNPELVHKAVDRGLLPWWTYPGVKARFLRPVTAVTHWLDYTLWPHHPWLMHLHNLLWYAALIVAVGWLYREHIQPLWLVGLSTLLYAVDGAHAFPAAWVANRNACVAAFFGVLAVIAHGRWRGNRWRAGAVLGPGLLLASLLAAEGGLGIAAYLFAYAVCLDRGSRRSRIVSLLPYAVVIVAWRVVWSALDYGVSDLGLYADPLDEPLRYAGAVIQRVPILLLGQWGVPPSDVAMMIGARGRVYLCLAGIVVGLVLLALCWPLLRKDRLARFWGLGMSLSFLPVAATFPHDRLLLLPGIGAMGLLAMYLRYALPGKRVDAQQRRAHRARGIAAGVLILLHLVIAPIALVHRSAHAFGTPALRQAFGADMPLPDQVGQQDLIIVNPPSPLHVIHLPFMRALNDQPVPRHLRALVPGLSPVNVHRTDDHTLVITPDTPILTWVFIRLFRNEKYPFHAGDQLALTGMTVDVLDTTPDGRPTKVAFRFGVPLEDPSLWWVAFSNGRFEPFEPPEVGESVTLDPGLPEWIQP
jgi:hypothetical protein